MVGKDGAHKKTVNCQLSTNVDDGNRKKAPSAEKSISLGREKYFSGQGAKRRSTSQQVYRL